MLIITCPFCGPRDEVEFACGGEAHIARPLADHKFRMPILPIIYSCATIQKACFLNDGGTAPDAGAGLMWHAIR